MNPSTTTPIPIYYYEDIKMPPTTDDDDFIVADSESLPESDEDYRDESSEEQADEEDEDSDERVEEEDRSSEHRQDGKTTNHTNTPPHRPPRQQSKMSKEKLEKILCSPTRGYGGSHDYSRGKKASSALSRRWNVFDKNGNSSTNDSEKDDDHSLSSDSQKKRRSITSHVSTKKKRRMLLQDTSSDDDGRIRIGKTKKCSSKKKSSISINPLQDTDSDNDSNGEYNNTKHPRRSPRKPKSKRRAGGKESLEQLRNQMFNEDEEDDDERVEDTEEPPLPPLCKNCNEPMHLLQSQKERSFGKEFYKCWCAGGGDFIWLNDSDQWRKQLPNGPKCKCGRPSFPILTRGTREKLWVCSKTGGDPCSFELTIGDENTQSNDNDELVPHDAIEEGEEFLCGLQTIQALQRFFDINYEEVQPLLYGDYRSTEPRGYYDNFSVERAWKVNQGKESVDEFEAFRQSLGDVGVRTQLRDEHQQAIDNLVEESTASLAPLDKKSNEALLLHGTKPEVVYDILVQGLNPDMASNGLFGRGTYFAEHPAKINQYVKGDAEYKGGNREKRHGTICTLHNKLYPTPELHPANVFYCFISRVVLGGPDCTTERISRPRNGGHSIVAELGNNRLFREFVIFNKNAIKIEYVVAYTRQKSYCACGDPVRERTFQDNDLGNQRKCICCPNRDNSSGHWEGGCGLFSPLPRCFCPRNDDFWGAFPDTSKGIYRCKKNRCGFTQLIEQGVDLREREDEDSGSSDYSSDDGFVVKDKLYEMMK